MERISVKERHDWRQTAETHGFAFHTIDGKPYWDETAAYLAGPQGPVAAAQARHFRWSEGGGPWQFELATEAGALVHRAQVDGSELVLPDAIVLAPGVKYVWGITAAAGAPPVDWTEFTLAPAGQAVASAPGPDASRSERRLYAIWLRSQRMPRAATRVLAQAAP